MRCTNCSKELPDTARFCDKCGTRAGSTEQSSAGPPGEETVIVGETRIAPGTGPTAGSDTCSVCGTNLLANARFCAKCGTIRPEPSSLAKSGTGAPSGAGYRPAPGHEGYGGNPLYGAPGRDWIGETLAYVPRVFRFERDVFKQIRTDSTATPIAIVLAVLAMFIFGAGGWLWVEIEFDADWELFWKSALIGTVISFGLWLGGALITTGILNYVYQKPVRFDEVVRVTGAASTVLALGFLMFIPGIAFGVTILVVVLWMMVTVVALQSAFDLEPREAIVSVIGGFALWSLAFPLIVSSDNTLGPGIWVFEGVADAWRDLYDVYAGRFN